MNTFFDRFGKLHAWVYRHAADDSVAGSRGSRAWWSTSTGRNSGATRDSVLVYADDGDQPRRRGVERRLRPAAGLAVQRAGGLRRCDVQVGDERYAAPARVVDRGRPRLHTPLAAGELDQRQPVRRATRRRRRAARSPDGRARRTAPDALGPRPAGRALLGEGARAFARVVAVEHPATEPRLDAQRLVERARRRGPRSALSLVAATARGAFSVMRAAHSWARSSSRVPGDDLVEQTHLERAGSPGPVPR